MDTLSPDSKRTEQQTEEKDHEDQTKPNQTKHRTKVPIGYHFDISSSDWD